VFGIGELAAIKQVLVSHLLAPAAWPSTRVTYGKCSCHIGECSILYVEARMLKDYSFPSVGATSHFTTFKSSTAIL